MSIAKVTDAATGKLKKYEDEHRIALAVVINGRLRITAAGAERGLVVSKGKLHEIGKEFSAG